MSYLELDAAVPTGQEPTLVAGEKSFTGEEFFFYRHERNGKLVVPGTILLELMMEASAFTLPSAESRRFVGGVAKIRSANFFAPVFSTDRVTLYAKLLSRIDDSELFHCEAKVEGELRANAEMLVKRGPLRA